MSAHRFSPHRRGVGTTSARQQLLWTQLRLSMSTFAPASRQQLASRSAQTYLAVEEAVAAVEAHVVKEVGPGDEQGCGRGER